LSTIVQALKHAQQLLLDSDSPALDAEVLLCLVLGVNRAYLRTWPERELTPEQWKQFQALIARRQAGEPIAYITGTREFWDMTLKVTPATLIPRPETELLVELALERIPIDTLVQVADLGTGSGAIALAIARERPQARVVATDASEAALAVARENAEALGVANVVFCLGHWFEALTHEPHAKFHLIASNPPYVHPQDPHLQKGDLRFEPASALASENAGLADIEEIARGAREHLHPGGWLLLEHGYDQAEAVTRLLMGLGYRKVETVGDLAQRERVSLGWWNP
jgi:release factor glutamine methyltransferase